MLNNAAMCAGLGPVRTWGLREVDLHYGNEGSVKVVCLWLLGVEDLHRVGPSGDGEDGLGEGRGRREGGGEGRGKGRGRKRYIKTMGLISRVQDNNTKEGK